MSAASRVSVVLSTHNGARYVSQQLSSILRQSRPVDEVVVGDDASSDGTADIVARLLESARATGVDVELTRRDKPLGILGNFADGLSRATGDVIFLSDQDDVWNHDKVERIMAFLEQHPHADGAFSDAFEVDAAGHKVGRTLWEATGMDGERRLHWERDPLPQQLIGNTVTGATMALRRDVLDLVLPFPATGYHDAWIALLLAAKGAGSLVALPDQLMSYRIHGDNASGGLPATGRFSSALWYCRRGQLAEGNDYAHLLPAIERLERCGIDTALLREKADFAATRHSLPANPLRRARPIKTRAALYRRYTSGRLTMLLDLCWYDAKAGAVKPAPRILDRLGS